MEIVRQAILAEAGKLEQKILALAVCSDHVHLVAEPQGSEISSVVRRYKIEAYRVMHNNGFVGKVWTRGYDKRLCFDESSLAARIAYVQRHNDGDE